MRKIKIKNSNNKEVILINKAPFILQSFEFKTGVNVYNSKGINQDGASYEGNTLDVGDATLQFTILAQSKEELQRRKKHINNVFNPKLGEVIVIDNKSGVERKVECIVTELPFFSPQSNVETICLISMIAHDPYFQDIAENKTDISTETGNFEFPLHIPPEGLELSIRTISFIANLYNDGDVNTPIKVKLKATGTVINPIIENLNTGKFIRIKRTLAEGDTLEINTAFGNKRVEIIKNDGSRENVFHYIDYKSTFFSIDAGDTQIKYDADVGNNNLDVSIYYTPNYLGI